VNASELTEAHFGWYIAMSQPNAVIRRRTFVLTSIRRWSYDGVEYAGLTDDGHGERFRTEWIFLATDEGELIRPITPKAKRRAKAMAS
jgi:hypothetical protein